MKCAAIGRREIDKDGIGFCYETGKTLATFGVLMRTGGAVGADTAFIQGYKAYGGNPKIFYKEDATEAALKMASKNHSAWNKCNDYSQRLLARNCQILFGQDLDDPVDFVVYWSKHPDEGGTGFGVNLARKHGIQLINLAHKNFPWWHFKKVGDSYEFVRPRRTKRRAFRCMRLCDSLTNQEIDSLLMWERRSLKEILESDRVIGMIEGLLNQVGAPADSKLNSYGRLSRFLNKHPELSVKKRELPHEST